VYWQTQIKRWHPDKFCQFFGYVDSQNKKVLEKAVHDKVTSVAKQVLQAWGASRRNQKA